MLEEIESDSAVLPPSKPKFSATPDQQKALDLMTEWLATPDKQLENAFFLLKGYAGTGKSFCSTELTKGLRPSEICFTAPTNKAVKVLRNYLDNEDLNGVRTATIYSLLGLSLQANGEVKELSKPEEPVDLSSYKVIIVDEASMVNKFLMSAIEDAFLDWNVPFIFMGDPAQLPPVGELRSSVFSITNGFELTEVLRYGNSMLDLATAIRKIVDHPFPSIKIETNPPVYKLSRSDWLDRILVNLPLIAEGDAKIIAWRNVTVDKYNSFIRENIYGKPQARANTWLPTDKLVATAMVKDLENNIIMRTDEEATIIAVGMGQHPLFKEFEIYNLLVENELGKRLTLRTLTATGAFQVSNRLNELSMEAKSGKKWKWREFWELKEAFAEVRHSYAITTHRSQGSSYLLTFIDLEDILLNRNRQEAFRSLYVACTRQREGLYIS